MKKSAMTVIATLVVFLSLLTSCDEVKIGYAGSNIGDQIHASYRLFTGEETKTITADAGDTIVVHYASEVEEGDLSMKIVDSAGTTTTTLQPGTSGSEEIHATSREEYKLIITGTETKGSFSVSWETP